MKKKKPSRGNRGKVERPQLAFISKVENGKARVRGHIHANTGHITWTSPGALTLSLPGVLGS